MKEIWNRNSVVLFQGDSVTDCKRSREDMADLGEGYAGKIVRVYQTLFPQCGITFVNRGVSGNRSGDLLDRYEEDFKNVKPDFLSILIGINDTWRRYDQQNPTTVEQYEKNYRELLDRIKRDMPQTRIMLIEPFLLHSDESKVVWHEDLDPKIRVVRRLAAEYADYFVPMDGILQKYVANGYKPADLSEDGVHPSQQGHGVIAGEYLKELGLF